MGEDRDHRLIIPGSVFVLFFAVIWAILHLESPAPPQSVPGVGSAISSTLGIDKVALAIVAILVTGYAAGFLLSTVVVFFRGFPSKFDSRKLEILATALGLKKTDDGSKKYVWMKRCDIACLQMYMRIRFRNCLTHKRTHFSVPICQELASEMSMRLHSHAPEEVCSFLARRLTTMYTSYTCILSVLSGSYLAVVATCLFSNGATFPKSCCLWLSVGMVELLIVFFLLINGRRARNEHWQCLCKFIEWDTQNYPYSPSSTIKKAWTSNSQ